jgi:hypothetical protein
MLSLRRLTHCGGQAYIVTFRRQKDRRPSKFIVVTDSMREA